MFDSVRFKIPQSISNSPTKDTKNYHVANVHPMFVIDQFFSIVLPFSKYIVLQIDQNTNAQYVCHECRAYK